MIPVLALAFLALPIAELAVIIAVARRIGVLNTIGLLVLVSIVGSVLAKREGLGVWRRFRAALERGEVPSGEILDGVLVLAAGALLLTPGFITDVLGLSLLFPATRAVVKAGIRSGARRRVARAAGGGRRRARGRVRQVSVVRVTDRNGHNSP